MSLLKIACSWVLGAYDSVECTRLKAWGEDLKRTMSGEQCAVNQGARRIAAHRLLRFLFLPATIFA